MGSLRTFDIFVVFIYYKCVYTMCFCCKRYKKNIEMFLGLLLYMKHQLEK